MADRIEKYPLEPKPAPVDVYLGQGLIAGLVSGTLFAAAQMIVSRIHDRHWMLPWRLFASVLLGQSALAGPMTVILFLIGFFIHFILAAAFGMVISAVGLLLPPRLRSIWGLNALISTCLGAVLWVVNFEVIARLAYPWFLSLTNPAEQILLHAFTFGLPVGVYLTAEVRRRQWLESAA